MQNQKVIEQLGYSKKEAKVYLAALELGEAHMSDIAERVKLPPSNVQIIVDKLHKDGLMNFYVMRRYKYWVAENPDRILASLERREKNVREAIPALQAIRQQARMRRRQTKDKDKQLGPLLVMADSSPQPILIANDRAEIEYVNAAWESLFGYSLLEVKGENPRMLKSGQTPKEVYARMWDTLNKGKLFQSDEIVDRKKDGSRFNLLTTIFPVIRGNNTFYVQILDDITEKKRVAGLKESFIGIGD